jgi:tetratricopeptide (TPR) repeat protein
MVEEAIDHWGKAGRQAIARSTMAEAASHLRRALEWLPDLSDTPARWRRELDLLAALGTVLTAIAGYTVPETGQVYDRARALCERLGDTPRLVTIANGQCIYHLMRAEMEAALKIAEGLLRRAEQEDSLGARLAAHRLVGITVLYRGCLQQARRHLEAAARVLDEEGESVTRMAGGKSALVVVPTYRAILLLLLGHYNQAKRQIARGLAEARKLERPSLLASTLAVAAWLHVLLDEDAPHHLMDALSELVAEQGFPYWATEVPLHRGLALIRAGETRQGNRASARGCRPIRCLGRRMACTRSPLLGSSAG